jgi:hypothetical protein
MHVISMFPISKDVFIMFVFYYILFVNKKNGNQFSYLTMKTYHSFYSSIYGNDLLKKQKD